MRNAETQSIHINQLLHGYKEGHRLLAGSIKPENQSSKTLLALSDLSGQGLNPSSNGYITGYPLPEMRAYALARTWLAPEMSRPGCVWTHTLLIDFSDLAAIDSTAVLGRFRRPSSQGELFTYSQPLFVDTYPPNFIAHLLPINAMTSLVEAVYGSPNDSVFVQVQEDFPADDAAMALWLQQWPRLRRSFRFCTWAPSNRSRSNERFDLQFLPRKQYFNESRRGEDGQRWVDLGTPLVSKQEQWATVAAADAIAGNRGSNLRNFIWRYGAEVEVGRAAFKPLTLIWKALENRDQVDMSTAVSATNNITPSISNLSQRVIQEVARFVSNSGTLSSSVTDFLIRNLSLLDETLLAKYGLSIAAAIWQRTPNYIWPLFRADSIAERSIAAAAAKLMKPRDAIAGVSGNADLLCAVMEANHELTNSPIFWDAPEPIPSRAADLISTHGEPDKSILDAMLRAENTNVPEIGIKLFGQTAVNTAVEFYDASMGTQKKRAQRWITAAKMHNGLLQTAVAQCSIHQMETLALIASLVSYRSPPVSDDRDEWVSALNSVQDNLGTKVFAFHAFLLGRALSGVSPESGSLIHASFDTVHNSLLSSRRDDEAWLLIARELPDVPLWKKWDRAHILRLGVVETFINHDLPPIEFLTITQDSKVFSKLLEIAASSSAGLAYFEKVRSSAKKHKSVKTNYNYKIIEKAATRIGKSKHDRKRE